jgi:hypothetical protein
MTTAVFVLPTSTAGQQGPVAAWLSTAGWAGGAAQLLGTAWVVTPDGVFGPEEAHDRAARPSLRPRERTTAQRLPTVVKTAVKDLRELARARRFAVDADGYWSPPEVEFVWQRHQLFHRAGLEYAGRIGVPSVLFVPGDT